MSMNELMAALMPHLMIAPILLPLLTAALMLLIGEDKLHIKLFANLVSTLVGLIISVNLLIWVDSAPDNMAVYLAGNWSAPWGIVLVLDRLSAMMLLLTSCVAMAAALFAAARWHRAGIHFHPLFQLQIMGLCGAFLTGDLFSLFVFFEIMLAASYGLLLHGSGRARVQAGLHFIAINLAASSLFLIGASMLYGITGTLNMADLAQRIPLVPDANRGLLHAAAGILATAFLIKAAVWPLNFWLVPAYSSATAPVGALFAIMTKVGIYVILRMWLLLFGVLAGPSAGFGGLWLICGGLLTMLFGAIGMLGSQRLAYLAGFGAILSSGSVLAAIGFGQTSLTAGLLYYLPSSTLAICSLFLIADLVERWRNDGATLASYKKDAAPFLSPDLRPVKGMNLDDDQEAVTGRVIPAAVALLGLAFMAATLVITGMPPLSGFIGKFAMLSALLNPLGLGASAGYAPGLTAWLLVGFLIGTGILALIALTRIGILHFWATYDRASMQVRVMEGLPIAGLLMLCVFMTLQAGPVMQFMQKTAASLHNPIEYVQFVLGTKPIPSMPAKQATQKPSL